MYLLSVSIASSLFSTLVIRATCVLLDCYCTLSVFESVCCLLFCTFVIKQLLNAKFEYTNRIVAFTSHIRIAHISTTVARQHFRWIRKHLRFTMCLSNSQFTHTKCEPNILLFFPLFPVSISPPAFVRTFSTLFLLAWLWIHGSYEFRMHSMVYALYDESHSRQSAYTPSDCVALHLMLFLMFQPLKHSPYR